MAVCPSCAMPFAPHWLMPTPCPYPNVVIWTSSPVVFQLNWLDLNPSSLRTSGPLNVSPAICISLIRCPLVVDNTSIHDPFFWAVTGMASKFNFCRISLRFMVTVCLNPGARFLSHGLSTLCRYGTAFPHTSSAFSVYPLLVEKRMR